MANSRLCSIPDCGKPAKGRGWCAAHWSRWSRHGDPLGGGTPKGAAWNFLENTALRFTGTECLNWPYASTEGYGSITKGGVNYRVPRLVCELAHGAPPQPDNHAAHNCGNSLCVNPNHLRWATPVENVDDKFVHGTVLRGSDVKNSKLTASDVAEIRKLQGVMAQRSIADKFGVSQSLVALILSRAVWSHI